MKLRLTQVCFEGHFKNSHFHNERSPRFSVSSERCQYKGARYLVFYGKVYNIIEVISIKI